jgi:enamine deaminase RidA (YjgF/YER057c/UK114 family)
MTADRLISSGGPWEQKFGYSRATVAGNYVHVSGSTATVDGEVQGPGDGYLQTKVAYGVIERALGEVGLSLKDIVRCRIYVSSFERMDEVLTAHGELMGDVRPALTALAGLVFIDPRIVVEIECDAYSAELSK